MIEKHLTVERFTFICHVCEHTWSVDYGVQHTEDGHGHECFDVRQRMNLGRHAGSSCETAACPAADGHALTTAMPATSAIVASGQDLCLPRQRIRPGSRMYLQCA